MKNEKNAVVTGQLKNGFVVLYLNVNGIETIINVCDFGGTQKKKAKALSYKIYKSLEGK